MNENTVKLDKELYEKYCKKYMFEHIPPILKFPHKVIAIGDIHGDIKMLKNLLLSANIIDIKDNWIAENTYVVQVGDQLDDSRSEIPNTIENPDIDVLVYTNNLHLKALEKKSMFISLLGNHEIMNVMSYGNDINKTKSYLNYVSKKSIDIFSESGNSNSGYINRAKSFYPGNVYAKLLACTRLPFVVIGKYIFMHGGITNNTMKYLEINNNEKLFTMQYLIRKFLLGLTDDRKEKKIVNKILLSDIFWTRILSSIPDNVSLKNEQCEKQISEVLKILNINGIVVGHTANKIKVTCDEKLFHLNSMNSRAFDIFKTQGINIESPSALQINKDGSFVIIKDKNK